MKLVLAALLVLGIVVARRVHVQWQARQQVAAVGFRRVPPELLAGAERTWLVFTGASGAGDTPVHDELARHDPTARVVTLDARKEPHLAEALEVRTIPTVVLADRSGDVQAHLVGAPAVRNYLAARSDTA